MGIRDRSLLLPKARAFVRESDGQATTEYILLLSLTLTTTIALAKGIMEVLDRITLTFGAQLEKDLKTGRAPLNVWKN